MVARARPPVSLDPGGGRLGGFGFFAEDGGSFPGCLLHLDLEQVWLVCETLIRDPIDTQYLGGFIEPARLHMEG